MDGDKVELEMDVRIRKFHVTEHRLLCWPHIGGLQNLGTTTFVGAAGDLSINCRHTICIRLEFVTISTSARSHPYLR